MNNQHGYRVVLQNRSFLALWLAQIFSQLGDRVCFVIFVAVIAHKIGNYTAYQSWLYISFTIPAILLTAIAGVFIDRWKKKHVLVITNVLRAALILLLPLIDTSLLGIYCLAFLISSVTQFFVPAEASCIPMLVEKNQLMVANSLFTTTMMGSVIFGFVLGDPLINACGIDLVHFSITALFVISALFLLGIKEKQQIHDQDRTIKEFFSELKEGLIYIKNTPVVFNAMLKLAILFSMIVALCILSISISRDVLYYNNPVIGAQKFGYIVASSGLGMVLGSFLVVKLLRHKSKYLLIFSGFFIIGISLILLGLTSFISKKLGIHVEPRDLGFATLKGFNLTFRMIYTYFCAGIVGIGAALVAIPVQTILQSSIPENMRGKVFGVQFTLLSTASTLPVIIVALGADFIGVMNMLFIMGVPLFVFGVYNLYQLNLKVKKRKNVVVNI